MTLEQQLDTLAKLGLTLEPGVTIHDLLYSFGREDYEAQPFDLLLFMLGSEVEREPWGRAICSRVWNFDTECITGPGSYVKIIERLCRVAGAPDRLKEVRDQVDLDTGKAWLAYEVDGKKRNWNVDVRDDWADTMAIAYVIDDIERDGYRFYFKDNGQAMVLFYLDAATAERLNELSDGALQLMVPD
jgi:hypothetical protein